MPAIAWTNDDILSIGTLEINLCEIILQIQIVCVVKICWKMLSAKQWPFCSGPDVLTHNQISHRLSFSQCIMGTMVSQITSLTIVYPTVYSGADQRKHQSLRHWPLWGDFTGDRESPHKGPVTRKMFPFDDVIIFDPCIWEQVVLSIPIQQPSNPPPPPPPPPTTALVPVNFKCHLNIRKHRPWAYILGIYTI